MVHTMGKYGGTKPEAPKEREERFSPYTELCKFADAYNLVIELDKPFVEFPNLILKLIKKSTGQEVKRIILDDISCIDEESARLLNDLSKDQ